MIILDKVSAAYEPGKLVLRDVSLEMPDQGRVAIMGPSGRGKTTLLKLLCGLIKPVSGCIAGLEGRRIALQFQDDRLLPWYSALRNVMLMMPRPDAQRATSLLYDVGIQDVDARPDELSGGMQRRVALARALAFAPEVLLLDEPFRGMDKALKLQLVPLLRSAAPLVILCTHDAREAEMMEAKVIHLDDNEVSLENEIV